MKRLLVLIAVLAAVGISVSGCGSSSSPQQSAAVQCAKFKAEGQAFARSFSSGMPNQTTADIQRLATTSYKATAASHGYSCP